jgi:hypothetical protein
MSFSKKSDVKNHLSRRVRKNILPFTPATVPDSTGHSIEEEGRSSTQAPTAVLPRNDDASGVSVIRKSQA